MNGTIWIIVCAIGLTLGATIGLWPWIVQFELEGDVIRAVSLSIPILGGIVLWSLKTAEETRRQEQVRADRQRRLLVALRAEAQMHLDESIPQFSLQAIPRLRKKFRANIDAAKKGAVSMPVGVFPKENDVFDRIKVELSDLPDAVIGPVIRYYQADEYVVEMIKAFNAGMFETKSKDDRKNVLDQYILLGLDALRMNFRVLDALSQSLDDCAYPFDPKMQKARGDVRAFLEGDADLERLCEAASDDHDGRKVEHDYSEI